MKKFDIALCLSARLSHDIIGPVGAVGNGVEILQEDETLFEQALDLIQKSSDESIAKLKFYRFAYGAHPPNKNVPFKEMHQLANDYLCCYTRIIQWSEYSSDSIDIQQAQLFLNLLIILTGILSHPNKITVYYSTNPENPLASVSGEGKHVHKKPELDAILDGKHLELSTKNVQFYLVKNLLDSLQKDLFIEYSDVSVILSLKNRIF